jgi:two-component system phosphate regulon sensor histidine kinase PhoR
MGDWSTLLAAVASSAALAGVLGYRWQRRRTRRAEMAQAAAERLVIERNHEVDRLVASLAGSNGGLIVLDEHQRIVAANALAQELAALPANGGRGRSLRDLVPWPRLHHSLADLCFASGPDAATAAEFELNDGGGDGGRTFVVRVRALGGLGYAVTIDDQSRLKRLESLRRDFVANVSHELKTPLAAIQGFVETMLDDPEMALATRQRFLERIARQTERLTTLVGDLLTLSRLDEARGLGDGAEPSEFAAVVRETLRDLAPLAERRQVELRSSMPAQSVWLRADREGLRQVVGNLVDNAIKYTPEGGRVSVTLTAHADHVQLEVADTGIGLSPEDQQRVFERFYRVDRARSRDVGGTGLGLSIVKNTVRGFGGDVGVRSAVGQGSTFWVRLPLPREPAGEAN